MDARETRIARNESLFREVNERIEEVHEALGDLEEGHFDFLCECGNGDCTAPVSLTIREYEDVRKERTHFTIVPGHEAAGVERVLATNDRFAVVEKVAAAARVAGERDPRS